MAKEDRQKKIYKEKLKKRTSNERCATKIQQTGLTLARLYGADQLVCKQHCPDYIQQTGLTTHNRLAKLKRRDLPWWTVVFAIALAEYRNCLEGKRSPASGKSIGKRRSALSSA